MSYEDPIIKKYIELFKARMPAIKEWYQGDPLRIPASNLPVAMISKIQTSVGPFTNSQDEHGIEMQLTLITDIRSELSTQEDEKRVVAGVSRLYELMEARNDDFSLKTESFLGVLRGNILVDSANNLRTDLNTLTRIEYGETLRDRDAGVWSIEARIGFVAHFVQIR